MCPWCPTIARSASDLYGSLVEHGQIADPVSVIARRVRQMRARQEMTAQQLADRLKEAGVPWDRATVTKLETGRRQNVTVTELLGLAFVLNVAPVHLLVPLEDRPYHVTPTRTEDARDVRAWVRGRSPLPGTDRRIFQTEVPLAEVEQQYTTSLTEFAHVLAGMEGISYGEALRRIADQIAREQ